jgi:serine/threonine-protein kinase
VLADSGAAVPSKLSLANATVPEPPEHEAPKLDAAPPSERLTEAPAIVKPMGRLSLAVSPWGEVYVDGKKRGLSPPLTEIKLPPGTHAIEIRNTTFAPYAGTVNVEADASVKVKHRFR